MSFWKCGATDAAPHTVIHAPTRGATWSTRLLLASLSLFQSTPRTGGDYLLDTAEGPKFKFQSTPHMEATESSDKRISRAEVSIHAPR